MRFSFVLCTRNSQRVLSEVIESIAAQRIDRSNIEVILSDHKSTDLTIDIAANILKKYNIKYVVLRCEKAGKSPALTMALNAAMGEYAVIVDDDNILFPNYIEEAELLLNNSNVGCLGSHGVLDVNIKIPPWFHEYKGHYAIGIIPEAKDWVWGACAIINMAAWKKLRKSGFEIYLNPARKNQSHPIALGGEDTELSLAIYMLGYEVRFAEQLRFIHKFEQARLSEKYLLENTYGCCRSVPVTEIYRAVIYRTKYSFPKFIWTLVLFRMIAGCTIKVFKNFLTSDKLKAKYNYVIAVGIFSGYLQFRSSFTEIYNNLIQIKKVTSIR